MYTVVVGKHFRISREEKGTSRVACPKLPWKEELTRGNYSTSIHRESCS